MKQLKAQNYRVYLKAYPHRILLILSVTKEPLATPKVRQALQYAMDRTKMATNLLDGVASPADQLMYPGHPWYDPKTNYKYDPAKAKQLLAEAGHARDIGSCRGAALRVIPIATVPVATTSVSVDPLCHQYGAVCSSVAAGAPTRVVSAWCGTLEHYRPVLSTAPLSRRRPPVARGESQP